MWKGYLSLLKISRQTELGEFPGFEDEAFSSYGPVTEYHGTVFAPEIDRGGLQGKVMSRHRAVRPPANMEGKPVVYTTTDKELAQQWAEQQAKKMNKLGKKKREPRVIAVRGEGLDYTPDPKQDAKSSFQQGEVRVRTPNIPRQRLVVQKEAKSPKALAHKRKYETEYESSPARKKYRRELERERRKRGVAGKGGGDMSHTKTGKIVVEDPHTNRARSHPSVGSTLKMVIVKDYYFKEPESYDEDGNPMQTTRTGKTVPLARGIASPKMKPKYNLAHPKNVALGEEGADAFAQFIGPAVMHEETHRAMEPDIRAAKNELPDTMTEQEKRDWYMRAHEIGAYQGQFPGGQDAHEEAEATALGQRDSPRHPFIDESVTRFPKPIVKMVKIIKGDSLFFR